jgi:threonine aldolase
MRVLQAMLMANAGTASSYGADSESAQLNRLLSDMFGREVACLPVLSGTAANALALSITCSPIASVLCHAEAHIARDERGAPEFFTGGGKLTPLDSPHARLTLGGVQSVLARQDRSFVHATPFDVLSLTNLTEYGTAYRAAEIAELAGLAHRHGLSVHLDGARLANALAFTGESVADVSVKAGVDVLCLGLTKTGAAGCEVIVLFDEMRERLPELLARAKRAGHLPPKMRFLSAQANALLEDGLWLELASTANARAQALATVLSAVPDVILAQPCEGNEVFVRLPAPLIRKLKTAGAQFYEWHDGSCRFVCAWSTPEASIDRLEAVCRA